MATLVTKGNTIRVPAQSLGGDNAKKVTVSWKQNFWSRTEDYWICTYTIIGGGTGEGVIFVQANKADEFKAKSSGDDITVIVDDKFQYGQNKELTKRFLVYHDKEHKPYQHRFVENTITALGDKVVDILVNTGYNDATMVSDIFKHFVGDYLKDF
ncbi:hypothetical protein NM208_g2717 [Fusarium decemcellulare]|uniref:Uncharacterized protein n=1 Tax=Fusarium decemcellulare TaxID=57161 RepID=A0ACC1SRM0_9HYPO|nr:hypothetical protein NM208_g2717 [Fusarium decemcellulare]